MITTETQFNRRKLITTALGFTGAGILAGCAEEPKEFNPNALTSFDQYRGYSNAYEFGTSKTDPAKYEDQLITEGWTVNLDGQIRDIDQIRGMPFSSLSEEVFNFRCVEAWECESTTMDFLYPNFLINTLTRIRNTLASLVSSKTD